MSTMNAFTEVNLIVLLEKDWFHSLLFPYLSFGDLHNLYKSSKVLNSIVSTLTTTWPEEIRKLNRIWCMTPGESEDLFALCGSTLSNRIIGSTRLRTSSFPSLTFILRLQVDSLSYDTVKMMLRGQPWSEVVAKEQWPEGL